MNLTFGQPYSFVRLVAAYSVELTVALVLILAGASRIYMLRRSQMWPVSEGNPAKILSEQRGTKHFLKILYSYRVQGELIQQVGKFEKYFSVANEAERWAVALNRQTLVVHFNPKKPSESVLWECELEAAVLRQR